LGGIGLVTNCFATLWNQFLVLSPTQEKFEGVALAAATQPTLGRIPAP